MLTLPTETETLASLLSQTNAAPVLITGSRGCGKSTHLSDLRLRLAHQDGPVIFASAETGTEGTGLDDLLHKLGEEGARVLNAKRLVHRRLPQLTHAPSLPLFEVRDAWLTVLIDGLDFDLSDHCFYASHFPEILPRGMRLVVAASEGPLADSLAARGFRVHRVEPYRDRQKQALLAGFRTSGMTSESGNTDEHQALLDWPPGEHPTHLEFAAELVRRGRPAPGPGEDVASVVDRLVEVLAMDRTERAMFAVCRRGVPRISFVERRGLFPPGCGIVARGGFFQPATPQVQEALRRRCSEDELRRGRLILSERLARLGGSGPLQEAVDHLTEIEDRERLTKLLTTVRVFQPLINRNSWHLLRAWQFAKITNPRECFDRLEEEARTKHSTGTVAAVLSNIGLTLDNLGLVDEAEDFYRRARTEARSDMTAQRSNWIVTTQNLKNLVRRKPERHAEAEALTLEMLVELGCASADARVTLWDALDAYAVDLEAMGRFGEALTRREEGITAVRLVFGAGAPMLGKHMASVSSAICFREPTRALFWAEQAVTALLVNPGPESSEAESALRTLAEAQLMLGHAEQAHVSFKRAFGIGLAVASRDPHRAKTTLSALAEASEAAGDWQGGLRYREEAYAHLTTFLGPDKPATLYAALPVAQGYERLGQKTRALGLMEDYRARCTALNGRCNSSTANATLHVARMLLQSGDRGGCENLLTELEPLDASHISTECRAGSLLLKASMAGRDGRADAQRQLLEMACALKSLDPKALGGLVHVVLGAALHLAGDDTRSLRHHEVGAQHLADSQNHWKSLALRDYETSQRASGRTAGIAETRLAELRLMLSTHIDTVPLARFILPPRPLRVAWNVKNADLLALLDTSGRSYLLGYHEAAGHLERLDSPFEPVEMPEDLTQVSFCWSESGSALRLCTPKGEQTYGRWADGESGAPASAVSPNGSRVVLMRNSSLRIVRGPES